MWDQLQYGSSLRGPWPAVRAASSGPRPGVTCPEPPWKPPHPSHLPPPPHPRRPSSSPGPATHPPERAGAASPVRSPRLTPSTGARGSLAGQSLEAATRRRAGDSRAAAGSEARLTAPRCGPSPSPPPPGGTTRPSAPPEGGSAINKRRSAARGPRSRSCAWPQIAGSGRPGSRHPEPPGEGTRAHRAQAWPRPLPPRSAPLPPHGSAAAAADAALAFRGPSPQRVQALL